MEGMNAIGRVSPSPAAIQVQEQPQRETPSKPVVEPVPDIEEVVKQLSDVMSANNMHLSFSLDDSSGKIVVHVTDQKTGKLIRQIPSADVLRIARNIRAMLGLFYDHSV